MNAAFVSLRLNHRSNSESLLLDMVPSPLQRLLDEDKRAHRHDITASGRTSRYVPPESSKTFELPLRPRSRSHAPVSSAVEIAASGRTSSYVSPEGSKTFELALRPRSPSDIPVPSAIEKGGFGTLDVLHKEIRQMIYGYAFDLSKPVTVKQRCRRPKPPRGKARRFDLLRVSKAIETEASWVLFNRATLLLDIGNKLRCSRNTHIFNSDCIESRFEEWGKAKMRIAQFRLISIVLSDLDKTNSQVLEIYLQDILVLLSYWWAGCDAQASRPMRFVEIHVGNLFSRLRSISIYSQIHGGGHASRRTIDLNELLLVMRGISRHGDPGFKFFARVYSEEEKKDVLNWLTPFRIQLANEDIAFEALVQDDDENNSHTSSAVVH